MLNASRYFRDLASGLVLGVFLLVFSPFIHAESRGLLWEIKSGKQTAYIFGSIHVAKADFYPLPATVEAAYAQAATVAVEVDIDNPVQMQKATPFLTYGAGDKLENHLTPATWAKLTALTGDATASLQAFKPAILATFLAVRSFDNLGFSTDAGLDLHFIRRAKKDGKPLHELETIEFQAGLLSNLSDADGEAMLNQTLDSLSNGEGAKQILKMEAAWKAGNADELAALLKESNEKDSGSKSLMKLVLDDRNPGLTKKILQLMRGGKRPFIVIGAAHMAGPNNILVLLQKQGVKVRAVR